jgi:hypothetical protein
MVPGSPLVLATLLVLAALSGAGLLRAWRRLRRSQRRAEEAVGALVKTSQGLVEQADAWKRETPERMARLLYDLERNLDLRVCLRQAFVVHGFPKTGNSTLAATIGALDICDFLCGGHHFSDTGVAELQRAVGHLLDPALRSRQLAYYYESARFNRIFRAQRHLHAEMRAQGDEPLRPFGVTSMRDPVAIFLSGVFFVHACLERRPSVPTAEVLAEAAFGKAPHSAEASFWRALWFQTICGRLDDGAPWYEEIDRWFERELAGVFGIDVFASPFPHERGWNAVESAEARGLLVRQEDFDRLAAILEGWFGLPEGLVQVIDDNRARARPDGDVYQRIQAEFRVPEEQLEAIYATRAVRHFYSLAEIERMKARWTG